MRMNGLNIIDNCISEKKNSSSISESDANLVALSLPSKSLGEVSIVFTESKSISIVETEEHQQQNLSLSRTRMQSISGCVQYIGNG